MTQHPRFPPEPADGWNLLGTLPSVVRKASFACADATEVAIREHAEAKLSAFTTFSSFALRSFTSDSISWTSVSPTTSDIFPPFYY